MNKDLQLLNEIYTDSAINSISLNYILTKAENEIIRKQIIQKINEYDIINTNAKNEIFNLGEKAPNILIKKILIKIENKISTSLNSNLENIGKIIVDQTSKKIIELRKIINKSSEATPKCYDIGRSLLKLHINTVETFSNYL